MFGLWWLLLGGFGLVVLGYLSVRVVCVFGCLRLVVLHSPLIVHCFGFSIRFGLWLV